MSLFSDTLANAERRFAAVQSAREAQSTGEENVAALEALVDVAPSTFGVAKETVGIFGGTGKEALRETREFAREEEEKKNQT